MHYLITMAGSKTLFCSSKFPTGTRMKFFEICGHFGHAPSKRFASPLIGWPQPFTLTAFPRYSCELTCEYSGFVSARFIVSTTIALSFRWDGDRLEVIPPVFTYHGTDAIASFGNCRLNTYVRHMCPKSNFLPANNTVCFTCAFIFA